MAKKYYIIQQKSIWINPKTCFAFVRPINFEVIQWKKEEITFVPSIVHHPFLQIQKLPHIPLFGQRGKIHMDGLGAKYLREKKNPRIKIV